MGAVWNCICLLLLVGEGAAIEQKLSATTDRLVASNMYSSAGEDGLSPVCFAGEAMDSCRMECMGRTHNCYTTADGRICCPPLPKALGVEGKHMPPKNAK